MVAVLCKNAQMGQLFNSKNSLFLRLSLILKTLLETRMEIMSYNMFLSLRKFLSIWRQESNYLVHYLNQESKSIQVMSLKSAWNLTQKKSKMQWYRKCFRQKVILIFFKINMGIMSYRRLYRQQKSPLSLNCFQK